MMKKMIHLIMKKMKKIKKDDLSDDEEDDSSDNEEDDSSDNEEDEKNKKDDLSDDEEDKCKMNSELFILNLLINKLNSNIKLQNLIDCLKKIELKLLSKKLNVQTDKININIDRFSKLNENIKDFIISLLNEFNIIFMNKYRTFIEYDYLTCNKTHMNLKISELSLNYIKEFNFYVNKKIMNSNICDLLESLKNLQEDTCDLRCELNNKILKKY